MLIKLVNSTDLKPGDYILYLFFGLQFKLKIKSVNVLEHAVEINTDKYQLKCCPVSAGLQWKILKIISEGGL